LDIQSRDALWDAVDKLREDGSTIVLTTHYLEEAQQRADRIGLMHKGTFHREGTVAELTRTLPAVIRFALPPSAPALPLRGKREHDGKFLIETFALQKDLATLLRWAQDHAVELNELQAGPTRLDDVFRAIDN
jgi:ABC-2 type transport system ATP-binding protein